MKIMFKFFFTILFCVSFFVQANGQTESIAEEGRRYDDRPLKKAPTNKTIDDSQNFEEVQTDEDAGILDEVILESKKKYKNFGKEVQGDTAIDFNDFELNKDSINAWKNSKNYAWIKTIEKDLQQNLEQEESDKETSFRENKKKKIGEEKDEESSSETRRIKRSNGGYSGADNFFNSGILKGILWTLAGLFICFLIYNLFLNKGNFGKIKKESKVAAVEEEVDENDMDNDFTSLQKKAYKAGDTRLAMRYMFLKMLQNLQQKGQIQFVADKTNAAYATELPDGYRNDFAALAMYFEYVWYGKLDIEKEVFDKIEIKYNNFLNRI
jgi:hypothetical protein